MALFTPGSVERVKEASDIVEVISAHTDLRRSGTRFTGLCPFHDERSPSFSVDPAEKLYHCFGCGVGGDVIKFVEEKEGLSFPDAVEALADRYGVELEREAEDPRAEETRKKRARLTELLERTAGFYTTFLRDAPQAARARDYLAGRGLSAEALAEFGVGCAPGTWDTILLRGQQAGYSVEEIEAAGLVLREPEGQGPLRPLPLADRVPDPRRARARSGVWGAGAAARPEAEVRQLARGRAVFEAAHAVRDRAGAAADGEERTGAGGRGIHGRDRLPSGRDARCGRDHGHRDHAGAGEAALGLRGGGGAGAGRRPRGARGDAAGADGRRQARCGCGSRGCPKARIPRTCSPAATGRARTPSAPRSTRPRTCRCSTSTRCSTTATWARRRAATGRSTRWSR